jgi:hypothetical protein
MMPWRRRQGSKIDYRPEYLQAIEVISYTLLSFTPLRLHPSF